MMNDDSMRRLELLIARTASATYYVCMRLGRPWSQPADPNPFPVLGRLL